jgi:hypothetical protein
MKQKQCEILVGGLEHFYFSNVIIPTDFHIFQRGQPPTGIALLAGSFTCWLHHK